MHCKIAFAGTDVAFHILVTLGREWKEEGGKGIKKEKETDGAAKLQNLLALRLTFHLSLSQTSGI